MVPRDEPGAIEEGIGRNIGYGSSRFLSVCGGGKLPGRGAGWRDEDSASS